MFSEWEASAALARASHSLFAPERKVHKLQFVPSVFILLSPWLTARPVASCRSGGLRGSGLSSSSDFPFISEYLSQFRIWLSGQRFASIQSISSSRGRFRASGVNREASGSAWWNRSCALSSRGGVRTPLKHGAASTDMQLCITFCALGQFSRMTALFSWFVKIRPLYLVGCR